ncbi:Cyclin-G-associated kinase [Echinococcus granulosus]|uniref:Cyclin-G-associated kinase n=1 Tax=Echinococcus granulosus TaxID=6210 RepID=W6UNC0_ECHGR|nr:Cyclin-G-associated kinase [Echinococcus granulosus]EUB59717.1 Cyclin-G-associated kinase [Echinococcus granulosus]
MEDFIKSAFCYFGGPSQGVKEHELVGESVGIGKTHFRIRRVIAEGIMLLLGGYAVVFEGYDPSQGKSFAIKRLFAQDQEAVTDIMNEIDILKRLSGHPNIMKFFGVACAGKERGKQVGNEFLIVTELCSGKHTLLLPSAAHLFEMILGGPLKDYLPPSHQGKHLPLNIVLQILAQTSCAIQHMHKQSPPIIHRDLKIENILLSESFTIKLCDFGSATTEAFAPSVTWSAVERGRVQESLEKVTTPMYRAPEMLDLYLNYPINEALDIWAFGCIMFYLVCGYHPFEDSAKLAILNANFNLPPCDTGFEPFHNLIRQMLLVDPTQRPSINSIYGELSDLATTINVSAFDSIIFNEEVKRRLRNCTKPKDAHAATPTALSSSEASVPPLSPSCSSGRPSVGPGMNVSRNTRRHCAPSPTNGSISSNGSAEAPERPAGGVLGFLKGSAGHLIKNIRETSSKVMEAVTAAIPNDLDLQYITSRIAVMSYPAESGLETVVGSRNSMEEAQLYLDRHHPNSYAVYNLSSRAYRFPHWFGGRVSFRPFESNRAPTLWSLVELCQNARLWLSQKPDNVCIIHCTDGRQLSAVLVCCLLCFCRVFTEASTAVKFFASKRGPVRLTPSQMRYIDYVAKLVSVPPQVPHNHPVELLSIIIAPIPSFNRLKNGCRPYVDVYQGNKKVFSSMTDYESLRTYEFEDRKIEITFLDLSVYGDVTISVYHARSFFAGKGKAASVKICQLQFHTGFINLDAGKVTFLKSELDHLHSSNAGSQGIGTPSTSRYAESFHTVLHLSVSLNERPRQGAALVFPWETLPPESSRKPMLCFSDAFEMRSVMSPAALRAAGYSSTGHPLSPSGNSSQPQAPRSPVITGRNEGEARQTGGYATPTSSKPTSAVDTLIEGLETNYLSKDEPLDSRAEENQSSSPTTVPSEPQADSSKTLEESATIGDLLDISTAASPSSPSSLSPPQSNHPPATGNAATPTTDSIFEDLFTSSASPSTPTAKSATADWHHPWGETAVNLNPFDPFGTATEPPEEQTPSNSPPPPPATPKNPSDFDLFKMRSQAKVHTSSSTSNLFTSVPSTNAGASAEAPAAGVGVSSFVHISSSSSNLTRGGNPFQEFGDIFETAAAKASSHSHSPVHPSKQYPSSSVPMGANNTARQPLFTPQQATPTPPPPQQQQYQSSASYTSPRHNPAPNTASPSFHGARPRVTEDTFEDLLGGFSSSSGEAFGSSRRNQQPKTLAEIRHQKLAQTEDREALKVIEWLEGKEKNVRALLCTLNSVLWEGVRWEQISMADVMTVKQVKQQYRKAARAVHPDKIQATLDEVRVQGKLEDGREYNRERERERRGTEYRVGRVTHVHDSKFTGKRVGGLDNSCTNTRHNSSLRYCYTEVPTNFLQSPEVWMNTEHMNMAKLILMELNDAMAEFERQEECTA